MPDLFDRDDFGEEAVTPDIEAPAVALDGAADSPKDGVLLDHDDRVGGLGQTVRSSQPCRAAADDHDGAVGRRCRCASARSGRGVLGIVWRCHAWCGPFLLVPGSIEGPGRSMVGRCDGRTVRQQGLSRSPASHGTHAGLRSERDRNRPALRRLVAGQSWSAEPSVTGGTEPASRYPALANLGHDNAEEPEGRIAGHAQP